MKSRVTVSHIGLLSFEAFPTDGYLSPDCQIPDSDSWLAFGCYRFAPIPQLVIRNAPIVVDSRPVSR